MAPSYFCSSSDCLIPRYISERTPDPLSLSYRLAEAPRGWVSFCFSQTDWQHDILQHHNICYQSLCYLESNAQHQLTRRQRQNAFSCNSRLHRPRGNCSLSTRLSPANIPSGLTNPLHRPLPLHFRLNPHILPPRPQLHLPKAPLHNLPRHNHLAYLPHDTISHAFNLLLRPRHNSQTSRRLRQPKENRLRSQPLPRESCKGVRSESLRPHFHRRRITYLSMGPIPKNERRVR